MAYDKTPLSKAELETFLGDHPKWRQEGNCLTRVFEFPSFPAAVGFVQRVAEIAEKHDHHPDIDIRFRKVRLSLTTHDAGGLTFRDPQVAAEIDALSNKGS